MIGALMAVAGPDWIVLAAMGPANQPQIAMSKPMRAKMQIQSVLLTGSYSETVSMSAVYGGSTNDEDNSFAKTTPSGKIELQIANKELHGVYKPGQEFYVDFTPIEKKTP